MSGRLPFAAWHGVLALALLGAALTDCSAGNNAGGSGDAAPTAGSSSSSAGSGTVSSGGSNSGSSARGGAGQMSGGAPQSLAGSSGSGLAAAGANGGLSTGGEMSGGAAGASPSGGVGGGVIAGAGASGSSAGDGASGGGGATGLGGSSAGGAGATGGAGESGGNGGKAGAAGSAGTGGAGNGGVTWTNVYVTWYGFDDNSCAVEAQHTCDNIAYPKSDGYPTKHNGATEGTGTYDDPVTFAASDAGDGETFGGATIAPGTIIYYAKVRKYFIMEDSCFECHTEWDAKKSLHVDLWMGPSVPPAGETMFGAPLINCEDDNTEGAAYAGVDTIIVNPPPSLPVDQTMLFTGTQCTMKTDSN